MEQRDKKGHRQRMRSRYIKSGFSGMTLRDIAELLLFYPISRRDTQPIAEDIQKRFKSLEAFLTADKEELLSIDGMGESAADFIDFFNEVCEKCLADNIDVHSDEMPELLALKKMAREYYSESSRPRLDALLLDNDLNFVSAEAICENFSGDYSAIDTGSLRQLMKKAQAILFCWNTAVKTGIYPARRGLLLLSCLRISAKARALPFTTIFSLTARVRFQFMRITDLATFLICADK